MNQPLSAPAEFLADIEIPDGSNPVREFILLHIEIFEDITKELEPAAQEAARDQLINTLIAQIASEVGTLFAMASDDADAALQGFVETMMEAMDAVRNGAQDPAAAH